MRSLSFSFALVVYLASTARAADAPPPQNDIELAKAHYNTGQIYYERGRYHDAAREFEEAYRLWPRSQLLYNMGKAYDGAGDFARALDSYRRFLDAAHVSPDRAEVEQRVTKLSRLVGRITLRASVDGSTV